MNFEQLASRGRLAGVSLAAAILGVSAPASAANLLTNGSFESPGVSVVYWPSGSISMPGWTTGGQVGGDSIVQQTNNSAFGGYGVYTSKGAQYLDLTGNIGRGAGVLSDGFATSLGTTYTVSFDVGAFWVAGYGSYGDATVDLFVNGAKVGSFTNVMGLSSPGTDWERFSYNFAGTGTLMRVGLYSSLSTTSSNLGVGLDDVAVEVAATQPPVVPGVPEPASWALMIAGFGACGLSLRRRQVAVTS